MLITRLKIEMPYRTNKKTDNDLTFKFDHWLVHYNIKANNMSTYYNT